MVKEWFCKSFFFLPRFFYLHLSSAINSDESSGRSFQAFQNVAKALNGTSAANSTSGVTPSTGAATHTTVSSAGVKILLGALLVAML